MGYCSYSLPKSYSTSGMLTKNSPRLGDANWSVPLKYSGGCSGFSHLRVYAHQDFWTKFNTWLLNMNHFSYWYGGYGMASMVGHVGIGTGSGYNGRRSWHNWQRAADITRIEWNNGTTVLDMCRGAHNSQSLMIRRRYLAVNASLRKYFGYVLDGNLPGDSKHDTHFHVDDECPILFNSVGSSPNARTYAIVFIQAACNDLNNARIPESGVWNTVSKNAYISLAYKLGASWANPFDYTSHYRYLLDRIMMHGFKNRAAGHL